MHLEERSIYRNKHCRLKIQKIKRDRERKQQLSLISSAPSRVSRSRVRQSAPYVRRTDNCDRTKTIPNTVSVLPRILMNLKTCVKLQAFLLSALFLLLPQDLFADESVLNQVLSDLEKGAQMEAFVPCLLEKYSDAVCVVTDKAVTKRDAKFHVRSLSIYDVKPEGLKKIFQ